MNIIMMGAQGTGKGTVKKYKRRNRTWKNSNKICR